MQAASEDNLVLCGIPECVAPVAAPETTGLGIGDSTGGIQHLLYDRQVHVERGETFLRRTVRVLAGNGLQAAALLKIEFNPSYQTVLVHAADVLRSGTRESRLARDRFSTVAVEHERERFIYNGNLEAILHLEDVRVGDTVEYAFTVRGENPVYRGSSWAIVPLCFAVSVGLLHHRLLSSADRPLQVRCFAGAPQPAVRDCNGLVERVWRLADYRPPRIEDGIPDLLDVLPVCQVSDGATWGDVVAWARELFPAPEKDDPVFARQVATLSAGRATPEERIVACLRFVQDEIRYLAFNDSATTMRARPPGVVLRQRYGDCKDKSLLLCCLLRAMGKDAAPALVNTGFRARIEEFAPSPNLFNHCVVCMDSAAGRFWYDPALQQQGGRYDRVGFPRFGAALVVAEGSGELCRIPPAPRGSMCVREVFTQAEGSAAVDLVVETEHLGVAADFHRQALTMEGEAATASRFREFYFTRYGELEVREPLAVSDDLDGNRVVLREHYRLTDPWKRPDSGPLRVLVVTAHPVLGWIPQPAMKQRTFPFAIDRIADVRYEAEIRHDGSCRAAPEDVSVDAHGLAFEAKVVPSDRAIAVQCRFRTVGDSVPPGEIGGYLATAERIQHAAVVAIQQPTERRNEVAPLPASTREPRWWMMYLGMALAVGVISMIARCSGIGR